MQLFPPTVGPIVGHTSYDSSRVWFRAEIELTQGNQVKKCFGALRYRTMGGQWQTPVINKMPAHFDATGVFPLANLNSNTCYEYQVGYFFAEQALSEVEQITDFEFGDAPTNQFSTQPQTDDASVRIAFGSCRYLLKLFGGTIFDERGDKTFQSMMSQHQDQPFNAVVMAGDQIYADDLNALSPDRYLDEFLCRYQEVFSQPHIRSLMASVPTYMMMDDHEIENDWPREATGNDRTCLFPQAMHAFSIYQASHGPNLALNQRQRLSGTVEKFWYTFSVGACDWFVMDVRTERNLDDKEMIGEAQLLALFAWLTDGSGKSKMIVSSVPFLPDYKKSKISQDKWAGFPEQRDRILDFIFENQVQQVVFVSGDVHCSFTVQLKSEQIPDLIVTNVVSSSFFWPYPHMDEKDFKLNGTLTSGSTNQYTLMNATEVHNTDNFGVMDISPHQIKVSYYGRKGSQLGQSISLF